MTCPICHRVRDGDPRNCQHSLFEIRDFKLAQIADAQRREQLIEDLKIALKDSDSRAVIVEIIRESADEIEPACAMVRE